MKTINQEIICNCCKRIVQEKNMGIFFWQRWRQTRIWYLWRMLWQMD